MIRLSRMTDYGIMLLTAFARDPKRPMRNARDLAAEAKLPLPTVSKILKELARHRLLEAHRGVKGGFTLASRPEKITVAEVINALEGPIAVTDCSTNERHCEIERSCIVKNNWRKINQAVLTALRNITLKDMTQPLQPVVAPVEFRGSLSGHHLP